MQLLPQDLGTKWHILLARNRSLGVASVWTKPIAPYLGTLGKRWIKDLPISEEVAATTLPLTRDKTSGIAVGFGIGLGWIFPMIALALGSDTLSHGNIGGFLQGEAITLGLAAAYGYGTIVGLPRQHLKKLHATPVLEEEITPFLTGNVPGLPHVFGEMAGKLVRFLQRQGGDSTPVQDDLERAFLTLVRDVVRARNVPQDSEDELRAALRSIGEALCRLPPVAEIGATGGSLLAADQLAEAQMLYARAEREHDSIIAGSLRRQAEALEAASRASENAVTVSRRVRALRQELRAQIDVLRLTLPTWGQPQQSHSPAFAVHSEHSLATIADAVKNVAQEAVSVSDAQDELDDFLHGRTSSETETYDTKSTRDEQILRAR